MLGCPILYVTIDPDMQWIAEVGSWRGGLLLHSTAGPFY
jgi:hypothetical protein